MGGIRMTFDHVLPSLVGLCEAFPDFVAAIDKSCVARDLIGRVRLVLKLKDGSTTFNKTSMEMACIAKLGRYFAPPILFVDDPRESGALAKELLDKSQDWEPVYEDSASGNQISVPLGRWKLIQARLSKQAWLEEGAPQPPWPLNKLVPIITFFSFKGGVGRTTALLSCAWQIARAGKRVAVIDLDLEAPGLGGTLQAETPRGILDFVVDFIATEEKDLSDLSAPAQAFGSSDASRVDVFPAGSLNQNYLEKLARLDLISTTPFKSGRNAQSPVEKAIKCLLGRIRTEYKPDFILIDSRAGLHDLAGLSLHGLAHIDVIVGRASVQGYRGLDLTLYALGRRKKEELLCVVVHSLAPMEKASPLALEEEAEFRLKSYESFSNHVYGDSDNDVPNLESNDSPHYPWIVRYKPALERYSNIGNVETELFGEDYKALYERILELSAVEGA
jgi:MinD-like ATPase involved in chromosome partitioning or flagellar assembly